MWLGIPHDSASSPTVYRPRRSIWIILSRCGWATVLRHSAACSRASNGVSFVAFASLALVVIVFLHHQLYRNIAICQPVFLVNCWGRLDRTKAQIETMNGLKWR